QRPRLRERGIVRIIDRSSRGYFLCMQRTGQFPYIFSYIAHRPPLRIFLALILYPILYHSCTSSCFLYPSLYSLYSYCTSIYPSKPHSSAVPFTSPLAAPVEPFDSHPLSPFSMRPLTYIYPKLLGMAFATF